MDRVRIVAADAIPASLVWRAFVAGFMGYARPFTIGPEAFAALMAEADVVYAVSAVALDSGGEPAGAAMLAIRGREGWCGGLGVVPALRGRGVGRRLMERLIANARPRGLTSIRLECLDDNAPALALYRRLGFRPLRRLTTFDGRPFAPPPPAAPMSACTLSDPAAVWDNFPVYHPGALPPPWQCMLPAKRAQAASGMVDGWAIGDRGRPVAYLLSQRSLVGAPPRRTILDAGWRTGVADPGAVLTALVDALRAAAPLASLFAVNVPDDDPLATALNAHVVPRDAGQTEFRLDL